MYQIGLLSYLLKCGLSREQAHKRLVAASSILKSFLMEDKRPSFLIFKRKGDEWYVDPQLLTADKEEFLISPDHDVEEIHAINLGKVIREIDRAIKG